MPKTAKDVLQFTGFTRFYRRFIRNYSSIALPLTSLVKATLVEVPNKDPSKPSQKVTKYASLNITDEHVQAFQALKAAFTEHVLLRHFDPSKPITPHSKSYIKPASKSEPTLGLSMADIIDQEKRNREMVKEAVAKRSLMEIQQEQAFQEWWDEESRRTQEEEARRLAREREREEGKTRGRRGRGGKARGGRGGGGSGSGAATGAMCSPARACADAYARARTHAWSFLHRTA